MIKFIGIAIISGCPVLFGFIMASRIVQSQQQIIATIKLIQVVRNYIFYESLTVDEIMKKISIDNQFDILNLKGWKASSVNREKYINDFIAGNNSLFMDKGDVKNLASFFIGLGTTDMGGQLNHCDFYTDQFKLKLDEVKKAIPVKRKLYSSLGIYAGMLVAIIML